MAEKGDPESATDRGVTLPSFAIEIVTQGWITSEPYSVEGDLCSHGEIRLVIGGRVIAAEPDGDFTISTSALALLRTLESDHSPEHPVADKLVMHCGELSMLGCPAGIDWSVSHIVGRRVRLSDIVVNSIPSFPGLAVEVAEDEYRRQVVAFARDAKRLFEGIEKVFYEDFERRNYEEFWQEYDARLSRAVESSVG